ncbi:MAG: type II secretion system GspH family protein [Opitutales bacterium]|nr:type II secretion system GspH family protein [Opitutales bacterium]
MARKSAFTILEVVAALAIFAVSATVLASAYVNVLLAYQALERDHRVQQDIRNLYLEVLNIEERDDFEEGGFRTVPHLGEVNWRTELEIRGVANLFEAEIHLTFRDPETDGAVEQRRTFTLFRPDWATEEENAPLRERTREYLESRREGGSF